MQRTATHTTTSRTGHKASPLMVWSALWSIYLIWGCTYLAIRVADRTLPPFLMAGSRFVVAGALMYGWAVWRGETRYVRPTARQWLGAAVVGGLLCLGGNGAVAWAEQHIDSGLTALIIATVPMWLAVMDRVFFGQRLRWPAVLGLAIGFGGLAVLVQAGGGKH